MYHFSKCRVHSLALLRHLVIFNLSRFSLFLYLFRLRNLIKSHFPTSPSPSNLNVKLTMAFSSYLSFPLVRMLLTSHSFMKRPLPCLISRPLKCCLSWTSASRACQYLALVAPNHLSSLLCS